MRHASSPTKRVLDRHSGSRALPSVRLRVASASVIVVGVVALIVSIVLSGFAARGERQELPRPAAVTRDPDATPTHGPDAAGGEIYAHVIGAVNAPGLVRVPATARVVDAIAAALGLAGDADPSSVNLARRLVDGEQLHIPRIGESPVAAAIGPDSGGRVNLNSASPSELQTLPRVGVALAQRIVDWRTTHGRFSSIDDLSQVNGFGEKTLDAVRDHVAVG